MQQTIQEKIHMLLAGSRRRRLLRKFVQVMCCIVVFVTTYMLILPAITLEQQTFCGMEEHSHATECYEPLVCGASSTECHVHTEDCYSLPEASAHIHSDACENPVRGDLICTAEETPGHTHDASCYEASDILQCGDPENHIHHDSCRRLPLVCTLSTDPHTHTEGCFARGALICSQETGSEGSDEIHSHDDSCYESVTVCGMDTEPHTHGEACYSPEPELSCLLPENHIHESSCYQQNLICTTEETSGHSHSDDCYRWEIQYICGREEGEPVQPQPELICGQTDAEVHTHSDTCFINGTVSCANTDPEHIHDVTCQNPVCGLEVHSHSLVCYSDPDADTESRSVWEATFAHVTLTGDWATDVVAIAESQLGYAESTRNYDVWEDNTLHGYTRYGAWYGVPYGDWCGMFASFCLNYAGVEGMPYNYGVRPWIQELTQLGLYYSARETQPQKGNLIFFDWDEDGLGDHVGIVAEVRQAQEHMGASIKTIEGNSSDAVRYQYYDPASAQILGYGLLPGQEMIPVTATEAVVPDDVPEILRNILICGMAAHSHDTRCYRENGTSICGLDAHTHTVDCVDPSVPVGYADGGSTMRLMRSSNSGGSDAKVDHVADLDQLITHVEIYNSNGGLVYESNYGTGLKEVTIGENCRIKLFFAENDTTQFTDGNTDVLYYRIPANLSAGAVGTGVIRNRNGTIIASYEISDEFLTITPVLVEGKNFFADFNNVTLEIEFFAEVEHSYDSNSTEINFNGHFTVVINQNENTKLDALKQQVEYDHENETITYKGTITAYGGSLSIDTISDWWWPDNASLVRNSLQLKDPNGNLYDLNNWNVMYSDNGFELHPKNQIILNHKQSITLSYQVKMDEDLTANFDFNNSLYTYSYNNGNSLEATDTVTTPVIITNVEKTGAQEKETVGDTTLDVLRWTVNIENPYMDTISITDQLGEGQTFCTHQPITIYAKRPDGTYDEHTISWDDVVRNPENTRFESTLPTLIFADNKNEYTTYELTYFSHYELDASDSEFRTFDNTVTTNVLFGNKPTVGYGSVGTIGVPHGIEKTAESEDYEWVTFTVDCIMPGVLNGQSNVLVYDSLGSWGNENAYIQMDPDSMVVTVTPDGGTAYTLQPYTGQASTENTYLLVKNGPAFTMYFNTDQADPATSVWNCPEDSTLTITYRVSRDSMMLDTSAEYAPTGETFENFMNRTNQGMNNYVKLDYAPGYSVETSAIHKPPAQDIEPLTKSAKVAINGDGAPLDGIYDYCVRFRPSDDSYNIFNTINGWPNDVETLTFIDTFDSRMEYVSDSFTVTAWGQWIGDPIHQVTYHFSDGKGPTLTESNGTTTMTVSAADLIGSPGSTWLSGFDLVYGMQQLQIDYYFEFHYQLRVKDEIKQNATEGVLLLDNVATIDWTDRFGSHKSPDAHNRVEYDTGVLQKGMTTVDNSNIVEFTILVNHYAADLANGAESYILYDKMSSNLTLLYNTLKVEKLDQDTGKWVTIPLVDCQFAYNPTENKMTFVLPNATVIKLSYRCKVEGTSGTTAEIRNEVEIKGRSLVQDLVFSRFEIKDHEAEADGGGGSFFLEKQDSKTGKALDGVTFKLYGDVRAHNDDVVDMIIEHPGHTHEMYLYDTIEIDFDNNPNGFVEVSHTKFSPKHLFALVEESPPDGYVAPTEPYLFYIDEKEAGALDSIRVITSGAPWVIPNDPIGYELPETGGAGTELYTAGGLLLILAAVMILLYSHKKCRKEDLNSS